MELAKTAASAYVSERGHEMGIIRVTSYHRCDFDLAVARTNPHDHNQVRSSLLRTIHTTSLTLGSLQPLPLKILYKVYYLFDVRSLLNFRYTNRRSQQIARGMRGYGLVITHTQGPYRYY
jgi:hypothetical protein